MVSLRPFTFTSQDATLRTRSHFLADAVVLVGVAASMGVLATGHWRKGTVALGVCVLGAGVMRAVLPERAAGLLKVRRRWFDAAWLLALGAGILALAMVVPPHNA